VVWSFVLSGALPSGSAGRAALQIGALEGGRDLGAPTRADDPASAAAASAASARGSGDLGGVRAGAAEGRLGGSVGTSGDAFALAPPAGQAALDLSAPAAGAASARSPRPDACSPARTGEPGLGLTRRIVGELQGLGISVSGTSVRTILLPMGCRPRRSSRVFMARLSSPTGGDDIGL
jgi:hypothetical protein